MIVSSLPTPKRTTRAKPPPSHCPITLKISPNATGSWVVAPRCVKQCVGVCVTHQTVTTHDPKHPLGTLVLVGLTPRAFDDPRRSAAKKDTKKERGLRPDPGTRVLRQEEETQGCSRLCDGDRTERQEQETRSSAIRCRSRRPRMGVGLLVADSVAICGTYLRICRDGYISQRPMYRVPFRQKMVAAAGENGSIRLLRARVWGKRGRGSNFSEIHAMD
ncbi:hypothetical protein QBC34DRAFT_648 [Podospora aff. communis PSN243]|uniref:Uncharacterized protein n=1 Tax=Podospora aff. communis PSN243 TaxID=3040156 RepID=A0AAV9H5M5_9PEZI|nr:hypothetical protein QBC34DRAFT_648 [Podospora aff. communis PSN243]